MPCFLLVACSPGSAWTALSGAGMTIGFGPCYLWKRRYLHGMMIKVATGRHTALLLRSAHPHTPELPLCLDRAVVHGWRPIG